MVRSGGGDGDGSVPLAGPGSGVVGSDRSGSVLAGRFDLERIAGRGATGVVYRAHDRATGAPVALKLLFADGDDVQGERFGREVQVLWTLTHPGIVRYVAHGELSGGRRFVAMEWVEGETLRQRLRREGLTIAAAVGALFRVADALGAVHRAGVVHRDLKPDNLIAADGSLDRLKILDFGIARRLNAGGTLTATGDVLGTPKYMAPEQARGEVVDERADVYALGAILFECLTGRPPFVADSVHAMLLKIVLDEVPRPSDLNAEVPEALDDLVVRILAKDPAERPRDGAALAAALGGLDLGSSGGAAVPVSRARPEITRVERRVHAIVVVRPGPARRTARGTLVLDPADDPAVGELVAPFGGALHVLADGSVLVTVRGAGGAELSFSAARCALALRDRWPEATFVVSFGHIEGGGRRPLGDAIDRAVSLLGVGGSGVVRLAPEIAGALEGRFEIAGDAAGPILRGERAVAAAGRTLLGRQTPCVGREQELVVLSASLSQCIDEGSARAVVVTGAPGVGKSRLRAEFLRTVQASYGDAVAVWTAQGDPMSVGSPLGLLARMLRNEAGLREGDAPAVREARLRARLARHVGGDALPRVTEFLAQLASVPLVAEPSVALVAARSNPVLMGDQMRSAWEDFVRAEATARPVVLVFEDLHWGDAGSVRFVDSTLRLLDELPVFVLALARPEVVELFPRLWASRRAQLVALRELGRKPAERLVRNALGIAAGDSAVERIVERAAGNPFYLEELVRAEVAGQSHALPDTVLAIVEARLGALEPEARRILRAGSVFGRAFCRGGVIALLGGHDAQADRCLDLLEEAEVLTRRVSDRFPGETELVFRHALVRDAAYAMLTDADREVGHRLAADWLERAGEADPHVVAGHLVRGGQRERAIVGYGRAAEGALDANDFEGAIAFVERAVECGARGRALGALRLIQAEAERWNANPAARAHAHEALALLPERSVAWYRAADQLALVLRRSDDLPALNDLAKRIDRPIGGDCAGAHIAAATNVLMMQAQVGGFAATGPGGGVLGARLAQVHLDEVDLTSKAFLWRSRRVLARLAGDLVADLRACAATRDAFQAVGDWRNACFDEVHTGSALLGFGCYEEAAASVERAQAVAARLGLPRLVGAAQLNLGYALAHLGRHAEGRAALETACATFSDAKDERMGGGSLTYLAIVLALQGELEAAEQVVVDALARLGDSPISCLALAVGGEVALERGRVDEALVRSERSFSLMLHYGELEEGEERVRLCRAEALEAAGCHDEARVAFAEARRALLARARGIDDAALRSSYLERVPVNARTLAKTRDLGGLV